MLYKRCSSCGKRIPNNATCKCQIDKELVRNYIHTRLDKSDNVDISLDQIYVVWFSKTLQNWKCLISTTLPDGMYYEVTHNGDNNETYLDAYKKWENVTYNF